jgi:hypothetical protein
MKNPRNVQHLPSTYQLLVQSEEKKRGAVEGVVYLLLVVATSLSIWQFSCQPVTFTDLGAAGSGTAMVQRSVFLPG